jgi:hypothetical protein
MMKHLQKNQLKIGTPVIYLRVLEVHVCWFLNIMHRFFPIVLMMTCRAVDTL